MNTKLNLGHTALLYKLLLSQDFPSLGCLTEAAYRDYYLHPDARDGSAHGRIAGQRLVNVLLSSIEPSGEVVTRGCYGTFDRRDADLVNMLVSANPGRKFAFVIPSGRSEGLMEALRASVLGDRLKTSVLAAKRRPADKQWWDEYLVKNIPNTNFALIRA